VSASLLCAVACKKETPPDSAAAPAPGTQQAAESGRAPLQAQTPAQRWSMLARLPAEFTATTGPATEAQVALGRMLYHDKRLSKNHDVSCASCHMLDKGGADGQPTSSGHRQQKGGRNSPSSLNAAGHFAQFWDGRAADVEAQAKGPILNPIEMAMPSPDKVIAVLKSMPEYVALFTAAFPGQADPVTYDNVGRAIGAFERQLSTPGRFDAYLAGDATALTAEEIAGLQTFVDTGCTACHSGALVGGGMYQKLGLVKPWPDLKDNGRFDVTKDEADKGKFKVPSLRNVAQTAPYFHDGSVSTLGQAVQLMARHQLGKELEPAKVKAIELWLGTLSGEVRKDLLAPPPLPASTATTPAPDPS
jgi:cytochrome c peroxidase